jgi:hypothetical protein
MHTTESELLLYSSHSLFTYSTITELPTYNRLVLLFTISVVSMHPTENLPTYSRLWTPSMPKVNQLTSKIYDPEIITETNLLATMAGLTIFSEEQKFNRNNLLQ